MPRVSVIIPAYNSAPYLERCIESISGQGFADWEAVVVVDGSPDDSAAIARAIAAGDPRVRVVEKPVNEGIHRGRLTGIEHAAGDYIMFLDADDELHAGCLPRIAQATEDDDADIFHLGINVIGVGISEGERSAFEEFINRPLEPVEGPAICAAAYSAEVGYLQDWRFTQRLYRATLLKEAASQMVRERLGQNEDGYEYFVASCLAKRQVTRNDIVMLDYYYGRGLNGADALAADRFKRLSAEYKACLDAAEAFASAHPELDLADCMVGFTRKAVELLANDWIVRVPEGEKPEAAAGMGEVLGGHVAAREVWRALRDLAYGSLSEPFSQELLDQAEAWAEIARSLESAASDPDDLRCAAARTQALTNLAYMRDRRRVASYDGMPVRIFVSTHKDVARFESRILQPVQVGAAAAGWRFPWALRDDEGENISGLNPMYCELTAQYWAWKNVDAEYYGFCHYRRYFDFSPKRHDENEWGEVMDGLIDEEAQERYCLDDASIEAAVQGWDVITTEVKDLRDFPGEDATPREHWRAAPRLRLDDLERCIAILKEMHPNYAEDADAFLDGHMSCFCNMFIMRKEIFRDYCAWLFPILERFCAETDMGLYSVEALRTPGHLSERLLNIYLMHHERTGSAWKRRQLQCVHFEMPEPAYHTVEPPALERVSKDVIPVVFAADDAYVPMLTTTIVSMMENASTGYFYDIVVLQCDITGASQNAMREFLTGRYPNLSLRFHNVWSEVSKYELSTNNAHISKETYYRFLVQRVLPHYAKVLYLDSDLIVEGDVAELFATELGENLVAATRDIDFLGNLNHADGERLEYARDVLHMKNPYDYFQAGVLLLNTAAMRAAHTMDEWLEFASEPDLIYNDQDVLNAHCEGRVVFLDPAWDVMHDCFDRLNTVFSFAPAEVYRAYLDSRSRAKIIHYAGGIKPWNTPDCEWASEYWRYARMTPFYERLLDCLYATHDEVNRKAESKKQEAIRELTVHERAISEESPLRAPIDALMPQGSRRRELAKSAVRALRGKK